VHWDFFGVTVVEEVVEEIEFLFLKNE